MNVLIQQVPKSSRLDNLNKILKLLAQYDRKRKELTQIVESKSGLKIHMRLHELEEIQKEIFELKSTNP
jgi:hypothetical protein